MPQNLFNDIICFLVMHGFLFSTLGHPNSDILGVDTRVADLSKVLLCGGWTVFFPA